MSLPANLLLKLIALYRDGCAHLQHTMHSLTGIHNIRSPANNLPYESA